MNLPLVSVIVPCFNQALYLPEALESVQKQRYEKWECIIINDGSTDNTPEVASAWCRKDTRFKLANKENGGLSSARNYGIKLANGDYLQFLDADDKLQKNKIQQSIDLFNANPIYDIVYSYSFFFETRHPECLWPSRKFTNQEWMPKVSGCGSEIIGAILKWNIMVVSSPLIKRAVIEKTGFFDENLTAFEDWDYWIRCALKHTYFAFLPYSKENATEIRSGYRSMMSNNWKMKLNEILVKIKYQGNKSPLIIRLFGLLLALSVKYKEKFEFNKVSNYLINN